MPDSAPRMPLVGLPTDRKTIGPHPFLAVGEKYVRAVVDGAGCLPLLLPGLQPPVGLRPILHGGGQESGLRSGTLATHQIVGMGTAFELAAAEREADCVRLRVLRDRLWQGIAAIGGVELNGDPERRVSNLLNVSFHGVEGESLQFALRELAVSAGSACSSASEEASYVLRALGRSDQLAQSSLRFSLGRFTTDAEIDIAIEAVSREVRRLRQLGNAS